MPSPRPHDTSSILEAADVLTKQRTSGPKLRRGIQLYRKAFRLGDTTGAYNLACTYQNLGDYRAAVRWFRRALAAGNASALVPLSQAELHGRGTPRRIDAGMEKLRRIARGGRWFTQFDREQAMVTLASVLLDGWLVRRDYRAAVGWLRRAARLGSAEARGLLLDLGE